MRAVDLFAGAGGFTEGADLAGAEVVWAANHWPRAVEVHAANHPAVEHACQDLQQADWTALPDYELLLASPACQGHSTAGQPSRARVVGKHDRDRNTAWAVISCAEMTRPRTILVENVAAFLRWECFEPWTDCLRRFGYEVRTHLFDAATFGVPQNRKRAIVTARLEEPLDLVDPQLPERAFGPLVDWDDGAWLPIAERPASVRAIVRRGRAKGHGDRFLMHYGWSGSSGRAFDRPLACVTTKVQHAAVQGSRTRMLSAAELQRAMGFRDSYRLPAGKTAAARLLGNAIPPPLAAEIIRQAAA